MSDALTVSYIRVEPDYGLHLTEIAREAALMALIEQRNVRFAINGREFLVQPSRLVDLALEECESEGGKK